MLQVTDYRLPITARRASGLVGGHCIPVDPYYLVYKAKELGYHPQVILAGRAINDYMPKDVEGVRRPVEMKWAKNVYWMYSILIEDEFGMSRDVLMMELEKKGIETRTFFVPMHEQPVFLNRGLFKREKYPVAEDLARKGLYLPSSSGLREGEIRYICAVIKEIKRE